MNITRAEAEIYLKECKDKYLSLLKAGTLTMVTVRGEMEHWDQYLANLPDKEKGAQCENPSKSQQSQSL